MILRIVKLTISPKDIDDFTRFFIRHKTDIETFEGCLYLELYREHTLSNIVMTYSLWKDNNSLDRYKNSETFGKIWPVAKKWFISKPEAHSYQLPEE